MNVQIGHDAALVESKKKLISGTYLHNAWYVAAWSDELAEGKVLGRTFLNEPVVLYRQGNGEVVALDDRCPHPITAWSSTAPAPACSIRTATSTSRRGCR
jgi:phenylpropionate dioxygenase-like ring-hydroxylating dioxygenase large terminal subunit